MTKSLVKNWILESGKAIKPDYIYIPNNHEKKSFYSQMGFDADAIFWFNYEMYFVVVVK